MIGLARRFSIVTVVVAVTMSLVGCQGDRAFGRQQVGATFDQVSGMPALVVFACPGQELSSLTLWLMSKNGNDRVRPLWAVSRIGGGTPVSRVVAGQVPDGYQQDAALVGAIPPSNHLEFVVQLGVEVGVEFRVPDLQSDTVLVDPSWFGNHRHVSMNQFTQENVKDCRSR